MTRCQHEPANFTKGTENYVYFDEWDINLTLHLCRLCGSLYVDLDGLGDAEKKYQEAQEGE